LSPPLSRLLSPAPSGVGQAALDAVHPQLSVQAVLGAQVVNTPRRLELEETSARELVHVS